MQTLDGKKIAIISANGFEQSELMEPLRRFREAGALVDVVSMKPGEVRGWDKTDWGDSVAVDKTIDAIRPDDYDAIMIPGGQINPDLLRVEPDVVSFVKAFHDSGKPMGAICHGPWVLIEAGVVKGRRMTSYHSIRTDLKNAGAEVVDTEAVVDAGIVTSRNPNDIPAFVDALADEIAQGTVHRRAA